MNEKQYKQMKQEHNDQRERMKDTFVGGSHDSSIFTSFTTEEDRIEFEKKVGMPSGEVSNIVTNKLYKWIKKQCRRGKSVTLDSMEGTKKITVKKYGKDDYRCEDGNRIMSSKMIDKLEQDLKDSGIKNSGVEEIFNPYKLTGQLSQSLHQKGLDRDQVQEVLSSIDLSKSVKEVV